VHGARGDGSHGDPRLGLSPLAVSPRPELGPARTLPRTAPAADKMRASTERTIDPTSLVPTVSSCSTAKTRAVMQPPDRQVEVMAIRLPTPLAIHEGPPTPTELEHFIW
jgi:hypothetical protein